MLAAGVLAVLFCVILFTSMPAHFVFWLLLAACGGFVMRAGYKLTRFTMLTYRYDRFLKGDKDRSISKLAEKLNVPQKTVHDLLFLMIEKRYLINCYVDTEGDRVIFENETKPAPVKTGDHVTSDLDTIDEREKQREELRRLINDIRMVKGQIAHDGIIGTVTRIENIMTEILKAVESDPEKTPKIRSLVQYYLPQTLNLLRSCAQGEKEPPGERTMEEVRSEINGVLEKLACGYEKQLDLLFIDDTIDISSDIDALESKMTMDGLMDNEMFQTR